MNIVSSHSTPFRLTRLLSLLLASTATLLQALTPPAQTVFPTTHGAFFGADAAISSDYTVIGAPFDLRQPIGTRPGAAYVFSTSTGKLFRKLLIEPSSTSDNFGASVAISGKLAAIGAPGTNSARGAVYIFDLTTGKRLLTLLAPSGVANDAFGQSVAIEGLKVAVGIPGESGKGAVRVYTLPLPTTNPAPLTTSTRLTTAGGAIGDQLGASVLLQSNIVFAGAPGDESNRGTVARFTLPLGTELPPLTPSDGAGIRSFGFSLALDGERLLIGAPSDASKGAAYLVDSRTGILLQKITAPDGIVFDRFGEDVACDSGLMLIACPHGETAGGSAYLFNHDFSLLKQFFSTSTSFYPPFASAVAIAQGTAIVTSKRDSALGGDAGAANFYRQLAPTFRGNILAETGAPALGTYNTTHGSFTHFHTNNTGRHLLLSTLTGPEATGGRNIALYCDHLTPTLSLRLRTLGPLAFSPPGVTTVRTLFQPLFGDTSFPLIRANLVGPGVTPANDIGFLLDTGFPGYAILREGDMVLNATNSFISSFKDVSLHGGYLGTVTVQRTNLGLTNITAINDSCSLFYDTNAPATFYSRQEGDNIPLSINVFGQIAPRATASGGAPVGYFSSAIIGVPTTDNAGLHSAAEGLIAQKGSVAPGLGGPTFQTFIGETIATDLLFRATVSRNVDGITEGLWRRPPSSSPQLVLRIGQSIDLSQPYSVGAIQKYWASNSGHFVLVKQSGLNINAANDLALVRHLPGTFTQVLLREGEPAPCCGGALIGNILQVSVCNVTGAYAILASLTGPGSTAATNLALFEGTATLGVTTATQRLAQPTLRLRKGSFYTVGSSLPAVITQIRMTTSAEPSGAGNRGQSNAVGDGRTAVLITLKDKRTIAASL